MSAARPYTLLFNVRILSRRIDAHRFPSDLPARHDIVKRWVKTLRSGALDGVSKVRKRLPKTQKLSAAALARVRQEYGEHAAPTQSRRAEALILERKLSDLVNAAYGLTSEEIDLMWKTAPPRMPVAMKDLKVPDMMEE